MPTPTKIPKAAKVVTVRKNPAVSVMAKSVGEEVGKRVAEGRKVVLSDVMKSKGYSPATARHPRKVTKQSAYQTALQPFMDMLVAKRDAALKAINSKKLTKSKAIELAAIVEKLGKHVELLAGHATERVVELSDEKKARLDRLLQKNKR